MPVVEGRGGNLVEGLLLELGETREPDPLRPWIGLIALGRAPRTGRGEVERDDILPVALPGLESGGEW